MFDISFFPLSKFTKKSPKEIGNSFRENAIIKAKNAGILTNWEFPCLADDSGLSIQILSNQPGVNSARWAKKINYNEVFEIIKKKIEKKGEIMEGQKAFFSCCLALLYSSSKAHLFKGILKGKLAYPPRGNLGFGYDPIFIPNGYKKTLAELKSQEKNKISHRKIAITKLTEFIFEK